VHLRPGEHESERLRGGKLATLVAQKEHNRGRCSLCPRDRPMPNSGKCRSGHSRRALLERESAKPSLGTGSFNGCTKDIWASEEKGVKRKSQKVGLLE